MVAFCFRVRNYLIAERTTDTKATKFLWNEHSLHLANPASQITQRNASGRASGHVCYQQPARWWPIVPWQTTKFLLEFALVEVAVDQFDVFDVLLAISRIPSFIS